MKFFLAVLISLAVLAPSRAGVVITGEGRGAEQTIYISGNSLRIDVSGAGDDGQIIFRGRAGEQTLVIIDAKKNAYYEITPENVREIKSMIEQMESALQYLPEAQREQMRERMGGQFGAAAAERRVELEQSGERVNGWVSDRYAVYLDGKKSFLAWFAEPGQFGLFSRDLSVLEEFEKFWEPLASMDMSRGMMMFAEGKAGIPVKAAEVDSRGRESTVFRVKEVEKQEISASKFEIPGGLRRMELPFGGR